MELAPTWALAEAVERLALSTRSAIDADALQAESIKTLLNGSFSVVYYRMNGGPPVLVRDETERPILFPEVDLWMFVAQDRHQRGSFDTFQ